MEKRGDIWVSAALYTALGVILVTLILSVGMPFINKLKERNTVLQTKNVMYDLDEIIRTVYNEGFGSRRPLFVDIGEGEFEIDSVNDKIEWRFISEDKLGIEPGVEIKEGNLILFSEQLGQGYKISMKLDYKDEIDIKSDLVMLSGKYNLVVWHSFDDKTNKDMVEIKES